MANLNPTVPAAFVPVYQLEITDPVEAGPGGIDNLQPQQLVDRTQYLKDRIDAIQPFIPVFRGWLSGLNPGTGTTGAAVTHSYGISSASIVQSQVSGTAASTEYVVNLSVSIGTTNFYVRTFFESDGVILQDNNCSVPAFKPTLNNQFTIAIQDNNLQTQNLKMHFEIIKY